MKILKFGIYALVGLGLLGVAAFFVLGMQSKNGTAPGLADGRLAACPDSPNCVSSEEGTSPDKRVEPLNAEDWDTIPATIETLGGRVTANRDGYIAAEFQSAIFGFVDDVEFRLTEEAVHVRSASRVGESDLGANAKRVAEIRNALAQR